MQVFVVVAVVLVVVVAGGALAWVTETEGDA